MKRAPETFGGDGFTTPCVYLILLNLLLNAVAVGLREHALGVWKASSLNSSKTHTQIQPTPIKI